MELKREQIIKALECCIKAKRHGDCIRLKCPALIDDECIYGGEEEQECFRKQMSDVLALITSQEQRIKELTEELVNCRTDNVKLTEENERLKSVEFTCGFIKPHKVLECPIFEEIEKAKADTVRKMQERLKMCFGTYVLGYKIPLTETLKIIDQIAKEMLEGKNEIQEF